MYRSSSRSWIFLRRSRLIFSSLSFFLISQAWLMVNTVKIATIRISVIVIITWFLHKMCRFPGHRQICWVVARTARLYLIHKCDQEPIDYTPFLLCNTDQSWSTPFNFEIRTTALVSTRIGARTPLPDLKYSASDK